MLSSSTWFQQLMGKMYIIRCQDDVMVSDSFVFRKIKRYIDSMPSLYWAWGLTLSVFVAEWRGANCGRSKPIICNEILCERWDGIYFTTIMLLLATESRSWRNILWWKGGSQWRCNYFHKYLACETRRFSLKRTEV